MTWQHVAEPELVRFLDGELPEGRTIQIALHVDDCPRCMGMLQQLDELHLVVATSSDPTPPPELAAACWAAVQADVDNTDEGVQQSAPPVIPEHARSAPSAIAVAAVLGASAAGLLLSAGAHAEAAETMSAATVAVGALARALGFAGVGVPLGGLGVAAITIASTIQLVRERRRDRAA